MNRLFEFLRDGCWHKWATESIVILNRYDEEEYDEIVATGKRYILRCTKCGEVTKRDLI